MTTDVTFHLDYEGQMYACVNGVYMTIEEWAQTTKEPPKCAE